MCTCDSLVLADFREPIIHPATCPLGLPKNAAGLQAVRTDDPLEHICPRATLCNGLDQVARKCGPQHGFECELLDFTLKPLRPFCALAPQVLDLTRHFGNELVFFGELEVVHLFLFSLSRRADSYPLV